MPLEFAADALPTHPTCAHCGKPAPADALNGRIATALDKGNYRDGWYLHLFTQPLYFNTEGKVTDCRLEALCPEHSPQQNLSDSELEQYLSDHPPETATA